MSGERVRALVADARRTGLRQDTGPPPRPAPDAHTHFVTMVKPEVLTTAGAGEAMAEVARVLVAGDVTPLRCVLVPAELFRRHGYLLLHYPRLHRVAADGAVPLSSDARRELGSLLDSAGADDVVGAYEALTRESALSPAELESRCRQSGIHRLGSGSYASVTEVNRRLTIVLNGFLPALAAGYTDATAMVGLFECHSPREIGDLRAGLLGTLDPATAEPTSLRGALGALVHRRQGVTLSEGRNGVHLSAGHLEGMVQAWRYFATADGRGIESTVLGRSLAGLGAPMTAVAALAADHNVPEESGHTVAPHGATENLRRDEVLEHVRRWTAAGRNSSA